MNGDDGAGPNRTVFRPSPLRGAQPPSREPATHSTRNRSDRSAADDVPLPEAPLRQRNLLVAAGAPILALAAGLRTGRLSLELPDLHRQASAAIFEFDQIVHARYPANITELARYGLSATIDDVAMNLPDQDADRAEWARRTMIVRFTNVNDGGDCFWTHVDMMMAKPDSYRDVLELYHACMAAGFEGRYRVAEGGRQGHQLRMQQVYGALEHVRGLSNIELSPRWRGEAAPARTSGVWGVVALVGGTAGVILLVVYLALRFMLAQSGAPAADALAQLDPAKPMERWQSAAPLAQPEGEQVRTIGNCLKSQVDAGLVKVEQGANTVWIRTTNGELFKSASDQLEPALRPLFGQIAACIDQQPGPVRIDGYTDSDRIRGNLQFPDNQALSQARAEMAGRLIRQHLSDGSRVSARGYGDSSPIADNGSEVGKAMNRRVEIVLERRS